MTTTTTATAPTIHLEPATRPAFPFTALVGQLQLQRALLLAAVDPALGGVLISGPRGTAKSTAARALAALMPQAPFVTLPLAATLEQLVGTLNLEEVLRDGEVRLSPGVVARAHGGVLYVDEVNLLPDALVDALLDVAASGINTVERDGVSQQHAARFTLVGTMNPEEGELRPQLLDRFGLSVALTTPSDAAERSQIVRARLAFDADPQAVVAQHSTAMHRLAEDLAQARRALPALAWSDEALQHAAELALAARVDGLRADLVMLRAARALAALEGRATVGPADVDTVAELALAHRRALDEPSSPPQRHDRPAQTPRPPPLPSPSASSSTTSPPRPAPPSTEGDWGALPAQPEAFTRVNAVGVWPAKKA